MDTVSSTTHVWLMDQQTRTTSAIYATLLGLQTNGHIMKVQHCYSSLKTINKKGVLMDNCILYFNEDDY